MERIKLGLPISLSGRYSVQGTESFQGVSLYISDTNKSGGLFVPDIGKKIPIDLIYYDDESSVDRCKELTEKLVVNDGVDVLLGPYSSSLALGAAEVAESCGKTLWNHGGATDEIEKRGFTPIVSSISPASSYMRGILRLIRNTDLQADKVALLSAYDSGFSKNILRGAKEEAKILGYESRDFLFKSGEENLKSLIKEVGEYGPDIILGMGRAEDDINIAHELYTQKVGAKALGLVAASIKLFRDSLGKNAEGFLSTSQWEKGLRIEPDLGPTPLEFAERFKSAFNKEPDYVAAQGYHIGLVLESCVSRAGSLGDQELLKSAKEIELRTFYGLFSTDSTGAQRGHETVVVQWQGGKKFIVYPEHSKQASLIYPLK